MYEVEFSYPMDIWTGGSVWIGYCWTFEDAVEDFDRRIKHETIDSRKIDTVVMQKSGFIYIGKSRYQAEQALSYLKRNYPNPYLYICPRFHNSCNHYKMQSLLNKHRKYPNQYFQHS